MQEEDKRTHVTRKWEVECGGWEEGVYKAQREKGGGDEQEWNLPTWTLFENGMIS